MRSNDTMRICMAVRWLPIGDTISPPLYVENLGKEIRMPAHGFPAVGMFSAALTLVHWIQKHGREPRPLECTPKNGLMSHVTYYRHLPGSSFSAIISAAFCLVSGLPLPLLSSASSAASVKMRTCLGHGCEKRFPFEGPHIGFCPKCRKRRLHTEDDWTDGAIISSRELRRLGMEQSTLSEMMEL